jgi:hypothetical protein
MLSLQSLDDLAAATGKITQYGMTPFWAFSAVIDAMNPSTMIGEFDQGGFTLPTRDLYLTPSQLLTDYQTTITTVRCPQCHACIHRVHKRTNDGCARSNFINTHHAEHTVLVLT